MGSESGRCMLHVAIAWAAGEMCSTHCSTWRWACMSGAFASTCPTSVPACRVSAHIGLGTGHRLSGRVPQGSMPLCASLLIPATDGFMSSLSHPDEACMLCLQPCIPANPCRGCWSTTLYEPQCINADMQQVLAMRMCTLRDRAAALAQASTCVHQHAGRDISAASKLLQAHLQGPRGGLLAAKQRSERFWAQAPQGLQMLLGRASASQAWLGLQSLVRVRPGLCACICVARRLSSAGLGVAGTAGRQEPSCMQAWQP